MICNFGKFLYFFLIQWTPESSVWWPLVGSFTFTVLSTLNFSEKTFHSLLSGKYCLKCLFQFHMSIFTLFLSFWNSFCRLWPYETPFIWLIFSVLFFSLILKDSLDFTCQLITSKCSFLFSGYSFHSILFLLYR